MAKTTPAVSARRPCDPWPLAVIWRVTLRSNRHTPRIRVSSTSAASHFHHWRLAILDRPLSLMSDVRECSELIHPTHLRIPAARSRPSYAKFLRLRNQRAQGKPGARRTRSLACKVKSTRVSHHRFTGTPGLPCAMVLTVSFVLSPVTGLCCHRRPQEALLLENLTPASGRQDHTTSPSASAPFVRANFALRCVASIASRTQRP